MCDGGKAEMRRGRGEKKGVKIKMREAKAKKGRRKRINR